MLSFEDEADAIRIANSTDFALGAGVWTRDIGRALRMAGAIRSGTVWVNTYRRTNYASPFGGFGQSGIGRENGLQAVLEFTESKRSGSTPVRHRRPLTTTPSLEERQCSHRL